MIWVTFIQLYSITEAAFIGDPHLMTGAAHEGGSDKSGWEGSGVSLDKPQRVKGDRV